MSSGADVPRGGWCRGARSELQHGGECGLGLHPLQQLALRDDTSPIRIQLLPPALQDNLLAKLILTSEASSYEKDSSVYAGYF